MKTVTLILLGLICSLGINAQSLKVPTLSPFTEISQQVGLTNISLSYSRPSAKGREIFGDLVPFGEVWRTGANASTKLTFTEDVQIGGNPTVAGTYALYTIPGKETWTIIVHTNTKHRSIAGRYKKEEDAFRFEVKPVNNPLKVETFTIQFANIRTNGLDVVLSWDHTIVRFPIIVEVDKKIEAQMAEFLKSPENISGGVYFRAAEYYLHNNKDLPTAEDWINKALNKSPQNFRFGLLKAKIQHAQGNLAKAKETISLAHQWAKDASNANYIGQTKQFMDSIAEK